MKQIAILLFSLALLYSCKKDRTSSLRNQFSGKWEYIKFVGYSINVPALAPGNGKIIIIGQDGSFERRHHDTIAFKGLYFLEERNDCYGNDKLIFFKTTDSAFANDKAITIMGDSLFLSSPNCLADGGSSIYRRL